MKHYPESDERIFTEEGGGWSSADMSSTAYLEYAIGYRLAATKLIEQLPHEPGAQGMFLGYPAVFLFRHYLELNLKHAISLAGQLNETNVVPKRTHTLDVLWKHAGAPLGRVNMIVLANTITKVGDFIEAVIDQLWVDLERQAELERFES